MIEIPDNMGGNLNFFSGVILIIMLPIHLLIFKMLCFAKNYLNKRLCFKLMLILYS